MYLFFGWEELLVCIYVEDRESVRFSCRVVKNKLRPELLLYVYARSSLTRECFKLVHSGCSLFV